MLLSLATSWAHAGESRQLVLVASVNSPVQTMTSIETRMLFLGYAVQRGATRLRPIRNVSSAVMNDVFLQHVVAMSRSALDRRLLLAALQKGRTPPPEVASTAAVVRILQADTSAVSYLWLDEAQQAVDLRVLRVLWVE